MQLLRLCQKSLPAHLPPYRALVMRDFFPIFSIPNSGPQIMKCFSEVGACRYAFQTSVAITGTPCIASWVRIVLMLFLETTPA